MPRRPSAKVPAKLLLVACLAGAAAAAVLIRARPDRRGPAAAPRAVGVDARHLRHDGRSYTVVTLDLNEVEVRLFWKKADGSRYANFRSVGNASGPAGRPLLFAANAGIFDPSFTPLGLHVQDGRTMQPLNLAEGAGNFFLKPNGVFLIDAGGARIIDSAGYARRAGAAASVRVATQSGPLLLSGGQPHPAFRPESASRRARSGVGVVSPRKVAFALSDEPVTFDEFARLFRDGLGCREALYLDGTLSRFYAPGLPDRADDGTGDFAGILGAFPLASGSPSPDHP